MISYIGATIIVVGFIVCIKLFKLVELALDVIRISKLSASDIRNPDMDDDTKEAALQAHAIKLFKLFFLLTLGGAAALLIPTALVWLLELMDVVSLDEVFKAALSWEFIVASTVLTIIALRGSLTRRN